MTSKSLGTLGQLIDHFWWEATYEGHPNPELFVSRRVAEHYAQRAEMDGEVIRATGEVVAKNSV